MMFRPRSLDVKCLDLNKNVLYIYPTRFLKDDGKVKGYQHYFCDFANVYSTLKPHPHIVNLHDFYQISSEIHLTYEKLDDYIPLQFFMESYIQTFCIDDDKRDHLVRKMQMNFSSWKQNISLIENQIQGAIDHLSSLDLVHPDLAPNNIMWHMRKGIAKIIDLKTLKFIRDHEKYKWYDSDSYKATIIDRNRKIKKGFLANIKSPWR